MDLSPNITDLLREKTLCACPEDGGRGAAERTLRVRVTCKHAILDLRSQLAQHLSDDRCVQFRTTVARERVREPRGPAKHVHAKSGKLDGALGVGRKLPHPPVHQRQTFRFPIFWPQQLVLQQLLA